VTTLAPDELPADAVSHPGAPLWRTPGLGLLFTTSTTARLANECGRIAVVLLVLDRTGSPALGGGLVAAMTLPQLVSGPLVGAWLDRTHHRRSLFVAHQLLLAAVLGWLALVVGHLPSWLLLVTTATTGLTAPVITGGYTGLIGPLVPAPLMQRAYGAESTSYNVAGVGGPALAAVIAGAVSPTGAVLVAGSLALAALVPLARVPIPTPAEHKADSLLRAVAAGLRHMATTPPLRAATVATTLSYGGMGALPVTLPALAKELGAPAAAGGALISTFAIGALASSVALAAREPRTGPLRLAFVGVIGVGTSAAGLALAPTLLVAFAAAAVAGVFESPVVASTLTVRDRNSPPEMRTQVVTTAASMKIGAFALGAAAAGNLVAAHGARTGAWLLVSCQVVGVVLGALSLGRAPRRPRLRPTARPQA
jgi:MFS family permease